MPTIIEHTATLLESFEVGFRNARKEPYFILDSDSENIISAEVACALIRNPVVKLQLRMVATKEVPLRLFDPPIDEPHAEEEILYVHKRKRNITNENLKAEVCNATRDLFDVANRPI